MGKKLLVFALIAISALCCAAGLTSCGNGNGGDGGDGGHKHEYIIADVVAPTCTERGYTLFECSCGSSYKDEYKDALGHSFLNYKSNNDATCQSDGTKTAKCERCSATNTVTDYGTQTKHLFINYKSNNDATCTADGTETAKCENCNETHTKVVSGSKIPHNFEVYEFNNDATCSYGGTETSHCSMCGISDTRVKEGSAKGHEWDYNAPEWEWYYTESGILRANIKFHCCNDYSHTVLADAVCLGEYKNATCDEDGFIRGTATYNYEGIVLTDSYYKVNPSLGHDFEEQFTIDSEATCTADGSKSRHCSRCTATADITAIPSSGHDWEEVWTWNGYKSAIVEVKCKNDASHTGTYDAVIEEQITVVPECTKAGEKKYTASASADRYSGTDVKIEALPATGHTVATDKAIAATCTGDGRTEGSHCAVCGEVFKEPEYVEKLRHNFINSVCENCGIIEEEAEALEILVFEPIYAYESEKIISYAVAGVTDGATPNYVIIPSTYDGLNVTAINSKAFENCTSLVSVVIPESITTIEYDAFSDCTSLKSVTASILGTYIPESVTNVILTKKGRVTSSDFSNCGGIESLTLSDGVTEIAAGAISGLDKLKEIIIVGNEKYSADGVSIIETQTKTLIAGCANSVIPSDGSVTVIAENAFKSALGLTEILIPATVTEIQPQAFAYCAELDNIIVEKENPVYHSAYGSAIETQSKTLVAGSNRTIIPADGSVTAIGEYAFKGLSLKSIDVPDLIEKIGGGAFEDCSSLTEITLPFIGETLEENDRSYFAYIFGAPNYTSSWKVPSSLSKITVTLSTIIPDYAFYGCSYVDQITYPDVTSIGANSFYDCRSLTEIIIPASVNYIGVSAFKNCSGARTVYWNAEYCNRIEWGGIIFEGCNSLKTVAVDAAVVYIPDSAFTDCTSLNRVDITDLVNWCKLYFSSIYSNPLTYAHNLYLNGKLVTDLVIPENAYYFIYSSTFYNCTCLTSLTIGDNIESIGSRAFYGCTSLNSINIGSGLTNIEFEAFAYCPTSLEEIKVDGNNKTYYSQNNCLIRKEDKALLLGCADSVIPEEVRTINEFALSGCTFTDYAVPDFIETMCDSVFNGCSNLENLELPFVGDTREGNQVFGYIFGSTPFNGATYVEYRTSGYNRSYYIPDSLKTVKINQGAIPAYAFAYLSKLKTVTLPEGLTKIGDYAFEKCSALAQMQLPESLTKIGSHAFNETGLTQIDLPDGLVYMGDHAFGNCKFTEIAIPSSVTRLLWAFNECYDLKDVYITDIAAWCNIINESENFLFFGENLYLNGELVTELVIPEGVERITHGAFSRATCIEKVVLPASLKEIGARAFYGCENITEIEFKTGLLTIGDYAFRGCTNLTEVILPEGVKSVGSIAFYDCKEVTRVYIPSSITDMGSGAFLNCPKLERVEISADGIANWCQINFDGSLFDGAANLVLYVGGESAEQIYIPDGVTAINNYAFYNFKNIKNVRIPDSIEYIGKSALPYSQDNTQQLSFNEYENGLYLGNEANPYLVLIDAKDKSVSSFTINENTVVIYAGALQNCAKLTEINLPLGLKCIGDDAFNSTGLTSVVIPDGTLYIGNAFSYCNALKEITVPNSVISVGNYAFRYSSIEIATVPVVALGRVLGNTLKTLVLTDGDVMPILEVTSLESLTLPEGMTAIPYLTIYYCTNLKNISIPDSVSKIEETFSRLTLLNYNYYDGGYYLGNSGNPYLWLIKTQNVADIIVNENTKYIGNSAFYENTALEKVVLPEGLLIIGSNAFNGCSALTSITIPESVTSIQFAAFGRCTSLEEVVLPSEQVELGGSLFYNCDALKKINLPSDITSLPNSLFSNCISLENIIIPDGVSYIGSVFYGCTALENIIIPDGVTEIGANAFYGCTALESITIPDSVKKIGDYAFSDCTSLNEVTIPAGVMLGSGVFDRCPAALFTEYGNAKYFGTQENPYLWLVSAASNRINWVQIHPDTVYIAAEAFYAQTSLSEVTVPEGVQYIGKRAFYWTNLTELVLPSTVKIIEEEAFTNCNNLTSISIPDGIEYIGKDAFSKTNLKFNVYENGKYLGNKNNPYVVLCGVVDEDIDEFTFAEGTRAIYDYAFVNTYRLTGDLIIKIPDSVVCLGYSIFYSSEMKAVIIGGGVKNIIEGAFSSSTIWSYYEAFYNGTQSEWEQINIESPNGILGMPIYFYSENKPENDGYYWHYDTDGVKPVKW